jgi:hypothetical protein
MLNSPLYLQQACQSPDASAIETGAGFAPTRPANTDMAAPDLFTIDRQYWGAVRGTRMR